MRFFSLVSTIPPMHGVGTLSRTTMQPYAMLGSSTPHRQARLFLRPELCLILFCIFLLFVGGCYWLKYGKLMRTHVEVLQSMANKMADVLEDRQTITPTMMNEFSYPLARARDFVRIVGGYYGERRSLQTFNTFLDVYAALLQEADRLRVLNADLGAFRQRVETLRAHGATVTATLTEEGS